MSDAADESAQLSVSESQGITVVCIDHQIMFDDPVNELVQAALVDMVKEMPDARLVLDMRKVEALGSRFLGTMLAVRRRVVRRKGRMVFANMKPEMLESFRVTQLTDMFKFYDSVDDAITSFGQSG